MWREGFLYRKSSRRTILYGDAFLDYTGINCRRRQFVQDFTAQIVA